MKEDSKCRILNNNGYLYDFENAVYDKELKKIIKLDSVQKCAFACIQDPLCDLF